MVPSKPYLCACFALMGLLGAMEAAPGLADEVPQQRKKVGVLEKPNPYLSPSVKSPAPNEWFRQYHDWGSGTLTGDWFGVRNSLGDHGVAFGIRYVSISTGNWSGGLNQGFYGGQPIGLTITVDTESLFGWKGGTPSSFRPIAITSSTRSGPASRTCPARNRQTSPTTQTT